MMEEKEFPPESVKFPTQSKEFWLLGMTVIASIAITNMAFYYGFYIGFAVVCMVCILVPAVYLLRQGHKLTPYSAVLLLLSLFCAASLARSDDAFVKFITVLFTFAGANLGLCLLAGQGRRSANGFLSLLDAMGAFFSLGFDQMGGSIGGMIQAGKHAGPAAKSRSAVLVGLLITIPVLALLIPLLMRSDAAFEGMMALLPEFDLGELIVSVLFGSPLALVLYTHHTALHHASRTQPSKTEHKGINALTVNTVLVAVCIVYLAYLFSQLAYFTSSFSGILPQGFTMAEYARRGFFEMAWITGINLLIMVLSVAIVAKTESRAPLVTRLLCLFIALVSLFIVVAASAKMLMYIDAYGLTRLRLLTQVIMIFLGLTVVFVTVWLFLPKFAYMKAVMITALTICCCVAWADVDTMVASYNVNAYLSGQLSTIDTDHLQRLGDGAIPYLELLTEDEDRSVATDAKSILECRADKRPEDIRSYSIADILADDILDKYTE